MSGGVVRHPSQRAVQQYRTEMPAVFAQRGGDERYRVTTGFRGGGVVSELAEADDGSIRGFPVLENHPVHPRLVLDAESADIALHVHRVLRAVRLAADEAAQCELVAGVAQATSDDRYSQSSAPSSRVVPDGSSSRGAVASISRPRRCVACRPRTRVRRYWLHAGIRHGHGRLLSILA